MLLDRFRNTIETAVVLNSVIYLFKDMRIIRKLLEQYNNDKNKLTGLDSLVRNISFVIDSVTGTDSADMDENLRHTRKMLHVLK